MTASAPAARATTAATGSPSAFSSSGFAATASFPVSHRADAAACRTAASGSDNAFASAATASGCLRPPSQCAASARSFASRSFARVFA